MKKFMILLICGFVLFFMGCEKKDPIEVKPDYMNELVLEVGNTYKIPMELIYADKPIEFKMVTMPEGSKLIKENDKYFLIWKVEKKGKYTILKENMEGNYKERIEVTVK